MIDFFWILRQGITPVSFVSCYASKNEVLKMFLKRQLYLFFFWEMFNKKLEMLAFLL